MGKDFISINKLDEVDWDEIKHVIISLINDFCSSGQDCVIQKNLKDDVLGSDDIEKNYKDFRSKNKPAVAKDGGDIKFKEFKNGIVKVQLQGSCSGCQAQ